MNFNPCPLAPWHQGAHYYKKPAPPMILTRFPPRPPLPQHLNLSTPPTPQIVIPTDSTARSLILRFGTSPCQIRTFPLSPRCDCDRR
ncbi:hypothetical protein BDW02DRAFT_253151 [Decorospora gaudefroyi]|uniref:Uncharacterized protein n=1 Tax=Decorospora gaudefroyi TaxID=184978 RepID=A0A6A5KR26_9PLEO|nr:hypothetical protein BDW02DRAFT_253151 [Decorospora gaudefroyi]